MGHTLSEQVSTAAGSRRRPAWVRNALGAAAVVGIAGALAGAFSLWPRSPVDLGSGNNATSAGLYSHWQAGDLIVLVRHAERCDRSKNPCLGPADGITRLGSETATTVGQALKTLGMGHADVLTSPVTRTVQTAQFMVDRSVPAPQWLAECDDLLLEDAMAHKLPQRNLVAVTHSGCIAHVEKQLGYAHAAPAEYSSALFLTLDDHGKAHIIGLLNVDGWGHALKQLPSIANQNKL
ncbi:Ais protein [Pseudomonas sp. M47T1]|uniref:lipopolysaccharide core heptose(II)-phosphate phosphatase PmrG n=1 Tax=Pseudomonas sp. M47T1 TaxID=1179778 RepID=UPI0002606EE8|nr:histidine phosphatase family protein [Pseudomonas sp. M47T1]EIK97015.1 Ais protein [Pseudomonas sp. M47T1]